MYNIIYIVCIITMPTIENAKPSIDNLSEKDVKKEIKKELKDLKNSVIKGEKFQEDNEKQQKELERVYNLKDEAKGWVVNKMMSYRDIITYLNHKNDFVDNNEHEEFYKALSDRKNMLEEAFPDLKRNVVMYVDVSGQKKYEEKEEEKNLDNNL